MKSERKIFWKWWDTTYLNVSMLNFYFWTLVEALPNARWIVFHLREACRGRWGILNKLVQYLYYYSVIIIIHIIYFSIQYLHFGPVSLPLGPVSVWLELGRNIYIHRNPWGWWRGTAATPATLYPSFLQSHPLWGSSRLISLCNFHNGLSFCMFFCMQYIPHPLIPLYMPEPHICHELMWWVK